MGTKALTEEQLAARRVRQKRYHDSHLEKIRAYQRQWMKRSTPEQRERRREASRRFRDAHLEEEKARQKRYRERLTPEQRAQWYAAIKTWRAANAEKVQAQRRQYKEVHDEKTRAWRANNPEKVREMGAKHSKKARARVQPSYVRGLLRRIGFPKEQLTEQIVALEQQHLLTRRFITTMRKEIQNGS